MKLKETFESPTSRTERVIVFIDLAGSTAMKEREGEAGWLTTLGWFYDTIIEHIKSDGSGTIVKFLGDGMMFTYPITDATQAINTSIKIQEFLRDERKKTRCAASVGIATGEVVQFQEEAMQQPDYIGIVVDLAARLCKAASPQAIFIDENTAEHTTWPVVKSGVGVALKRGIKDYKGDLQSVSLKGFQHPVKYHEIFWDAQQRYGLKGDVVSKITEDDEREKKAREHYDTGVTLWNRGDRKAAVEILAKCVTEFKLHDAVDAIYRAGCVCENEGDTENACSLWRFAKAHDSGEADVKLKQYE